MTSSIDDPYDRVRARLVEVVGSEPRGTGQVRCPAHEDRSPSLSVTRGRDDRVVLHCHAGCTTEAVVEALGLTMSDLFPPRDEQIRPQVVARYLYADEHGEVLFTVERLEPGPGGKKKSFRQIPASGRRGAGAMQGVRRVPYRLPEVAAAVAVGRTVWIAEGEKDVDRLAELGEVATTNPGGAGKWHESYSDHLKGARVRIVGDDDQAGREHVAAIAASLEGIAESVVQLLPATGKDVSDHLDAGRKLDELRPLAADAARRPVDHDADDKMAIRVHSNPDAIRQIKTAIDGGHLPDVYVADGHPVQVERVSGTPAATVDDDSPLPVRASTLTGAHLASLLAHETDLRKATANDGWQEWTPPQAVLSATLAGAEWPGLSTLVGIVGMPVIRPDGTLLQDRGYDRRTGLYLAPKVAVPRVPDRPTRRQVEEARTFVFDTVLGDFEWQTAADRANYIGLLVTPFVRRYLRSRSPLGIITATMPGSGKTILTALIGLLAGQKVLSWADDDTELRKQITSAFTVEAGVVVFDNLDEGTVIASPILANLLTSPEWADRILGSTKIGAWPNERLWTVTGNNLRVGGDIASRSVLVRLSPRAPHPEQRDGFTIPGLDEWVMEADNRAKLLKYLLVLLVDWTANGAPRNTSLPNMRNFSGWAHGVGGFLQHHKIRGFLENLDDLRSSDENDQKWGAFLHMWQKRHGGALRRARELFEDATIVEHFGKELDPWDGVFITSARGARPRSAVQLGHWLAGHDGRYHGSLRLRSVYDSHSKVTSWKVEEYVTPPRV